MSVHKRKYRNGRVVWYYEFSAIGSNRKNRERFTESGFGTRKEATDAEAARRLQVQRDSEAADKAATPPPLTLGGLLGEYFADKERKPEGMRLAPKTLERYRELSAYLSPEVTALTLGAVTAPRLNLEWSRLLESGGHHRKTKTSRPLSAKTVRNIAGVVSSAFARAIFWQVATFNPVALSEPPVPQKRKGMALTPAQQRLLIEAASGCWCIRPFLELDAATGARRGEVLALRWSDYVDGAVFIARSLAQTKKGLNFKGTKTENPRCVLRAIQATEDPETEGSGASPVAALPWVAPARTERVAHHGVRALRALFAARYRGHLLACDHRPGPRSRAEMG